METLYIVIGAFSSILIFLLGYSVSGVFNGKKKLNYVESFVEDTERMVYKLDRDLHQRIDSDVEDINSNMVGIDQSLQRQLDSRLDKLESKLTGMIPPTNEELMKRIEKIEEESYRLRMNM
jgi:hypothetical protein